MNIEKFLWFLITFSFFRSKCWFMLIYVSCNVTCPAFSVMFFFMELFLLVSMHCFTMLLIFFFFAWELLILLVLCKKVVRHLILAGHEVHVVSAAPEFVFTSAIQSPRLFIRKVSLTKTCVWLLVIAAKMFIKPIRFILNMFQLFIILIIERILLVDIMQKFQF